MSEWIKNELDARGQTQRELGDAIGLSESQMSKLMHSRRKMTAQELLKTLQFFGYPVAVEDNDNPVARVVRMLSAFERDEQEAVAEHLTTMTRLPRRLALPSPKADKA